MGFHSEGLSLSIESVDLVFLLTVEALVREILARPFHFVANCLLAKGGIVHSNQLSLIDIPHKVIVSHGPAMEQGDVYFIHADPAARDEWIRQVLAGHGGSFQVEELVDVELISSNFFLGSPFFAEGSEEEDTVVEVDAGKLVAVVCLLHLFALNVVIFSETKLLMERDFVVLQGVHFQNGPIFCCFCNCQGPC